MTLSSSNLTVVRLNVSVFSALLNAMMMNALLLLLIHFQDRVLDCLTDEDCYCAGQQQQHCHCLMPKIIIIISAHMYNTRFVIRCTLNRS